MTIIKKNTRTLQLSRTGTQFFASEKVLAKMSRFFEENHFIRIRQFIEPKLLKDLKKEVDKAKFYKKVHKGIGVELCMREGPAVRLLSFFLQDRILFRYLKTITGCDSIGCMTGRIYRMNAGNHYDDWHDDLTENRIIAMSLNLSPVPYRGGHLLIRNRKEKSKIRKIKNTGYGDVIFFRLHQDLEHYVQHIKGTAPKTAYAGWFRSKPDYADSFKKRRRQMKTFFPAAT